MLKTIKRLFFTSKKDNFIIADFVFVDGVKGKLFYRSTDYNPIKSSKQVSLISKTKYFELGDKKNAFIQELLSNGVFQIALDSSCDSNLADSLDSSFDNKVIILNNSKETSAERKRNKFLFIIPVMLFFISVFSFISLSVCFKEFNVGLLIIGTLLLAHILASFIIFRRNDNIIEWGLFATLLGYFIALFFLWLLFVDEIYLLNPTADGPLYVTIIYPLIPNIFAFIFGFPEKEKSYATSSLKVVMIGAKKYPSRDGGIDAVVSTISEKLVERGNEVTVYTRRKNDPNVSTGVNTQKIFTINRKATDALIYSFFATIKAVFSNADVIHFHAEGNCFFLWLTRFSKKRIITTIHGLDWQREKFKGIGTKILLKSEKRIVKYSDDIIVLSQKDYDYFKNTYSVETTLIPNGFEQLDNIEPSIITDKYGLGKEDYFLFLARIVPEKGLHYLIEAYKQVKTDKKLVIAGDAKHAGDYFETIKKMAEDDNRIIFTGFVSGDELNELFSNTYLYVLPSDIEGMPISLLEALGHKRICLVSDIPENHLDDTNSYYFEKSSVDSLKEKLTEIDKRRKRFSKNSTLASWDEVVENTYKLYKKEDK